MYLQTKVINSKISSSLMYMNVHPTVFIQASVKIKSKKYEKQKKSLI